ncbi:MAG: translocation/assembly module TamB domain-containing protein, partial [Pseudomonadota bacterium]
AQDAPERREGQRGEADLNLDIANGEGIDPRLAGPVSARVSLGEDAQGAWTGNARIDAPQDVTLQAAGQLTGATPDVAFDARVPRLDAFVDGLPGALIADGRAFARDGVWSVDAELQGPWATTLQIDGPVTGQRPDIAFSLRLPDVTAPVPALASVPQLQGAGSITGDLVQEGGAWVIDAQAMLPADITSRVRGPVTGPAPRLAIAATLADVAVFVPQLSGPLSIDADLAQAGEAWVASARATGPANTRATVDTVLTASPLAAEFTLQAPRVAAFAPGVPGGLDIAGTATLADTGPQVTFSGTGPYNAALSATATLPDTGATVAAQAALPNGAPLAAPLAGPLRITVDAQQTGAAWRADVRANGPFGSQAEVSGTVAGAPLDVTVSAALPNIAAFVPDISGPLAVSGRVSQPGDAYALDLEIAGPSGTTADVTGTVSGGANLDLGITGSAPLGLANGILAPRRLGGQANFNLRLSGAPQLSNLTGTVSTTGAEVSLPTLRNGLDGVNATVTLGQGRAQVDAQAGLRSGGNVTIQGPVDLSAPFNGNLAVNFGVTLVDPTLYEAQLSGALQLAGPLANGARISGDITVDSADIAVPSSGLTAIGDLPPITHLNTPRPVQRTLARAGQTDNGGDRPAERSGPAYGLDLRILAPNRIFVRGRGVDAELGGALGLRGTTAAPITTGGFELVRGRLDILQQRFNFDEGEITFQGSLVPNIRLVAVTEADALTASIIVEGPADDITVRFESAPSVPQEEILAQVFFGRDLSQLSPLQALQLANSVAVLAGRGSGGLLERLRGSTGLDDLDVTTDSEGNTAVRAGKYISDNVYTDVQIDQDGDASVSLNLDLTPNLTVRGSTGASGESSVGIFFERDY